MPRFDGTGPQGEGPFTGRGEGYCADQEPGLGRSPEGYAGSQGWPMGRGLSVRRPRFMASSWAALGRRVRRAGRRGLGRRGLAGRGRW